MGQYRLYAVIWFFIFGFLGDYFEPGFLSIIFFILMGLSLLALIKVVDPDLKEFCNVELICGKSKVKILKPNWI